jgi:protein SCO1/2
MSRLRIVLALAAAGLVGWSMVYSARTRPVPEPGSPEVADAPEWRGRFPNVPLRTHDGRTVRFYDDLVRGRIVTINFMYVECEGTCPGVTSTLVEVKKQLGDRVGGDIAMLSITLQPQTDTPERLRDYARRYGAGPGMVFLTGAPADIDRIRRALGFTDERNPGQDADRSQHLGLLRIGNEPQDWWTACPSPSSAAQICALVNSVDWRLREADKAPLENPEGPSTTVSLALPDLRDFEALRDGLDRLHMTRATLELSVYLDQVLSRMAQYLKIGDREAAWRAGMKKCLADSLAARRRLEGVRRDRGDVRAAWGRYLEDQAQAMAGLDGILDRSPRHRVFLNHGTRWLFYLEGHPDHAETR